MRPAVGDRVRISRTATSYVPGRLDAVVIPAGALGTVVGDDAFGLAVAFPLDLIGHGSVVATPIVPASWLRLWLKGGA